MTTPMMDVPRRIVGFGFVLASLPLVYVWQELSNRAEEAVDGEHAAAIAAYNDLVIENAKLRGELQNARVKLDELISFTETLLGEDMEDPTEHLNAWGEGE